MTENLPAEKKSELATDIAITINEPVDLTGISTYEDSREADIDMANTAVKMCYLGWASIRSVGQIPRMVEATFKALEGRRNVLGLQYGHSSRQGGTGRTLGPIPD